MRQSTAPGSDKCWTQQALTRNREELGDLAQIPVFVQTFSPDGTALISKVKM